MNSGSRKAICGLLVFSVTLQYVVVPCAARLAAQDAPVVREGADDATSREMLQRLQRLFRDLEKSLREEPSEPVDLQGVLDKAGRDPVKIFEWVRDRTACVPYRGALRGPAGVILDRAGNSLDRALLLAELLRLTGIRVRLARCELPESAARGLLEKLPRSLPSLLVRAASPSGHQQSQSTAAEQQMEDCAQAVAEHTAAIVKRLPEDLLQTRAGAEERNALEALRDHWWVERQDRGAWIDQDLSPVEKAAKSKPEYVLLGAAGAGASLDARLWHEVEIRVVVEQWKDGRLKEQPALKKSFRPAEHLLDRIGIRHVPLDWPGSLEPFAEKEGFERLKKTVLQQRRWLPVLSIGDTEFTQLGYTDAGEVEEASLRGEARLARGIGATGGGLGGVLAGGDQESPESHLSAVWLECEIRSPGQPPRTIRREVFDFLGPAARQTKVPEELKVLDAQRLDRGLALLGDVEILAQVGRLPAPFLNRGIAQRLLRNRAVLERSLDASTFNDPKDLFQLMGSVKPVPGGLHLLALLRSHLSRYESVAFIGSPSVLTFRRSLCRDGEAGLSLRQGFDILANAVDVLPGSETNPFLVRTEQGVLDTNLEAMLMRGAGTVENTAELLSASLSRGIDWVLIRDSAELRQPGVVVPPDARLRMEQELKAGDVLLAPKHPFPIGGKDRFGWWRLDPRSGSTLGMMETGMGQSFTERIGIMIVVFGPGGLGGWLAFIGCAGKNYEKNSSSKNWACFFCAFLTGICITSAVLAGLSGGVTAGAGAALCGKSLVSVVVSGMACNAIGGYMD